MIKGLSFLLFFTLFTISLYSQDEGINQKVTNESNSLRLMFYNVENFFDYQDDPLTRDEEFLPYGPRGWNRSKFNHKKKNLYKVIAAAGTWLPPDIIGLCEVENRSVLDSLFLETPLSKADYHIIHRESPDARGIDVALVYRSNNIQLLSNQWYTLNLPNDTTFRSREILHAQFLIGKNDSLHVFVNHWPSRWGGQGQSQHKRMAAASLLKEKTDSLQSLNPSSNIVIMGDFNDEPEDKSIHDILKAELDPSIDSKLVNLMAGIFKRNEGTHFYAGDLGEQWSAIDQFIVSPSLLDDVGIKSEKAIVYKKPWLMELSKDGREKPFRTFVGYKYNGGFSDHLPILLDLSY